MKELNTNEELKSLSPILEKHGIEEHYEVPTGYFEELTDRIVERATQAPLKSRVSIPLVWRVAASVGLIAFVSMMMWQSRSQDQAAEIWVSIESDEALDYFINNTNLIEIEELEDLELTDMDFSDMDMLEINGELIDEYLDENVEGIDENLFDEIL